MNNFNQENVDLFNTICKYITDAMKSAEFEVKQQEDFLNEEDSLKIVCKHISKKFDYLCSEGWIDGYTKL